MDGGSNVAFQGAGQTATILRYTGGTAGDVLRFANKSNFSVRNLGVRFADANIAANALRLTDCVYWDVSDVTVGGPSAPAAQQKFKGIYCDTTTAGQNPERGYGRINNFLFTLDVSDSPALPRFTGTGSAGVHVKGVAGGAQTNIYLVGWGAISNAEAGVRFDYAYNCRVSGTYRLTSNDRQIDVSNSQYNYFDNVRMTAAGAEHVRLDATSLDNVFFHPGFAMPATPGTDANPANRNRTLATGDADVRSALGWLTLARGSAGTAVTQGEVLRLRNDSPAVNGALSEQLFSFGTLAPSASIRAQLVNAGTGETNILIGTQTGAGWADSAVVVGKSATTLTAWDKGGAVWNVKAYGAKGDGAADDTAAIQAALNAAAAAGGGVVAVPTGTYLTSAGLTAGNAVRIKGAGRGNSIIKYTGNTAGTDILKFTGAGHCGVFDLALFTSQTNFACTALRFVNCIYFYVDGLWVGTTVLAPYGQNKLLGILAEATTTDVVPYRGSSRIANYLYVVEPTGTVPGGARYAGTGSGGVWLKGIPGSPIQLVEFGGEIDIEHGEFGMKFDYVYHCTVAGTVELLGDDRGVDMTACQFNTFLNNRFTGSIVENHRLDAACYDNTFLYPVGQIATAFGTNGGTRTRIQTTNSTGEPSLLGPTRMTTDGAAATALSLRSDADPAGTAALLKIERGGQNVDMIRADINGTNYFRVQADGNTTVTGALAATSFTGAGSGLTGVAQLASANTFTAANTVTTGAAVATALNLRSDTAPTGTAALLKVERGGQGVDMIRADIGGTNYFRVQADGNTTVAANATVTGTLGVTGTTTLGGGTAVVKHLSATASLDFPNVLANTTAELTVTVTGAAVGDVCYAAPNGAPESGLTWSAYVSATNTVTVRVANATTGAINPAARTYRCDVWAH